MIKRSVKAREAILRTPKIYISGCLAQWESYSTIYKQILKKIIVLLKRFQIPNKYRSKTYFFLNKFLNGPCFFISWFFIKTLSNFFEFSRQQSILLIVLSIFFLHQFF